MQARTQASHRPIVAFVYPNPRGGLAALVAAGEAPDSTLLGQNHLGALGIRAEIYDPLLTRLRSRLGPVNRAAWSLRELTLPWELRRFDVAFTALANLFPLAAQARRRPRVVVVNYGLNTIYSRSTAARRRLLASSLRSAAAVVCLGRSQREELLEQTAVAAERTYAFPLGIDERYFAPRSAPADEEPFVLTVGKDLARDYRTFVEAVSDLGVRVEMVAYARNVAGIRLPPKVRPLTVPSDVLRDLYAGAGCVVIPQRSAGYPEGSEGGGLTALLEAMAMAKPVVASERPILADYVDDGRTALLVPPEDPAALREAIERVLGDSELARSLGEAARARVERDHTTRAFAARLAPVLVAAAG